MTEPFKIRTGWVAEFEDSFGNRLEITDYRKEEENEKLENDSKNL